MSKWPTISLLVICEVLAMALWFSASATIPAMRAEFNLSDLQISLISSSVSIGFVVGTLTSAALGLADRLNPKLFFMCTAIVASLCNLAILWVDPTTPALPVLRFIVGAMMAGVYPVGMKMASSWSNKDQGLLVGLLVGALTLGSASPHLIDALGGLDWRFTLMAASGAAFVSGLLILAFQVGPNWVKSPKFDPSHLLEAWTNKPLRLANLGYLGHMWELYAMWAWVGLFLSASFAISPGGADSQLWAKYVSFATIAAGAIGCLAGGIFADKLGRTTLTMGAMALSGGSAILIGFMFGGNPWIITAICVFWGVTVVADSAQFSASVIELSPPSLTGTMLTIQTSLGFLLTTLTIHAIPELVEMFGWEYAFMSLAIGPFLGVWAMAVLRKQPEAVKLANGNL